MGTPGDELDPVKRTGSGEPTLEAASSGEAAGDSSSSSSPTEPPAALASDVAKLRMAGILGTMRQDELLGGIATEEQVAALSAEFAELGRLEAERLLNDPSVTDAERMSVLRQATLLGGLPGVAPETVDKLADQVAANASARFIALAADPTATPAQILGALRQREMLGGFGGDRGAEDEAAGLLSGRFAALTDSKSKTPLIPSESDTGTAGGSSSGTSAGRLPDIDKTSTGLSDDLNPRADMPDDLGTRLGRPQEDDGGASDRTGTGGSGSEGSGSSPDEWAPFPGGSDPSAPPLVPGPSGAGGLDLGAGDEEMEATSVQPGPLGLIWVTNEDGSQTAYDPNTGDPVDTGGATDTSGTGETDAEDEGGTGDEDDEGANEEGGTGDEDDEGANEEGDDEDADDDEMPSPDSDSGTTDAYRNVEAMTSARSSAPPDPLLGGEPPGHWTDKTPGAGEPRDVRPPPQPQGGIDPRSMPSPDDADETSEVFQFVDAMTPGGAPPDPLLGDQPPGYWTDKTPGAGEPREIRPPTQPPDGIDPRANPSAQMSEGTEVGAGTATGGGSAGPGTGAPAAAPPGGGEVAVDPTEDEPQYGLAGGAEAAPQADLSGANLQGTVLGAAEPSGSPTGPALEWPGTDAASPPAGEDSEPVPDESGDDGLP